MKVKRRGKPDKIEREDWGFAKVDPDPDFSEEHNRQVMDWVVKETDKTIKEKGKEHDEAYRERAAAVAQYLKSLQMGGRERNIEKYFGRRELARLRGEEVMARLKDQLTTWGKDRFGKPKIIRRAGEN